jgi:hypothetical protein
MVGPSQNLDELTSINGPMMTSLTEPSRPKPLSCVGEEVRHPQSNGCFDF